jgi:hypothetical protein
MDLRIFRIFDAFEEFGWALRMSLACFTISLWREDFAVKDLVLALVTDEVVDFPEDFFERW